MKLTFKILASILAFAMIISTFTACLNDKKKANGDQPNTDTPNDTTNTDDTNTTPDDTENTDKAPEYAISLNTDAALLIAGIDGANTVSFTASATKDGQAVADASISWSVDDDSVVDIDQNGNVTAKAAGSAVITAKYEDKSAVAYVDVLATATAEQVNSFSGDFINTYGRTYIKDGALRIDHTASAIEVAIYGTSLSANVKATATSYLTVFVDGSKASAGRVKIDGTSTQDITIIEGLSEGYHTIRIVKATEMLDAFVQINSLTADNFVYMPENDGIKIEFVGDSISCGYGTLEDSRNGWSVDNSDATQSYAYYTSDMLDANYSIIAMRGTCVKESLFGVPSMNNMYPSVSTGNGEQYDFKFKPDVVVVNLGTNDGGYIDAHPDYANRFPEDYYNLLTYIRMKNPKAYIVCLYGMMGVNEHVDEGIKSAIEQMGDSKISYISSFEANFDSAGGHPSVKAAKANAKIVANHIKSLFE